MPDPRTFSGPDRRDCSITGGSVRGYQALSKLSAVGESRMPRADDGWRARPAVGTGCIPGSPTGPAGWIALVNCMTVPAPMVPGSLSARRRGGAGPL
jgi:hypothetical protein